MSLFLPPGQSTCFARTVAVGLVAVVGACTENPRETFTPPPNPTSPNTTDSTEPAVVVEAGTESTDTTAPGDTDPMTDTDTEAGETTSSETGAERDADAPSEDPGSDEAGVPPEELPDAGLTETEPPEEPESTLEERVAEVCGARPVADVPFTRRALREAAADCAVWHYCWFDVAASDLNERVQTYADAPGDTTLSEAQEAWRAAMEVWSHAELFQFGPSGSRSEAAGKDMYEGQGIRERIYAWPTTSRCRVEEQVISQNYATRGIDTALVSARGLFGLEVLLFNSDPGTECGLATATAQTWATLSVAELTARKQDYAVALSDDVATKAQDLQNVWSDGFRQTWVSAGGSYPSEQEVMQVMAWSLVYVEREVKDWKVGIPAGHTQTHPVSHPETPFARVGTEAVRANLRGFRSLFQGCGADGEGVGFDDWLSEAGHAPLADEMIAAWQGAQAAADGLAPLHQLEVAELDAFYQQLRVLTTLLKNEFFGAGSPLNLKLPGGVEGDTD